MQAEEGETRKLREERRKMMEDMCREKSEMLATKKNWQIQNSQMRAEKNRLDKVKSDIEMQEQRIESRVAAEARHLVAEELQELAREKHTLKAKSLALENEFESMDRLKRQMDELGGIKLAQDAITEVGRLRNAVDKLQKDNEELLRNAADLEEKQAERSQVISDLKHDLWVAKSELQLQEAEKQEKKLREVLEPNRKLRQQLTGFLSELDQIAQA